MRNIYLTTARYQSDCVLFLCPNSGERGNTMAMNPVLALINCDSEDKFVRDVVEAYFQNPVHVRDLLTEDCIEACLDDYMRNQDVIADVRDLSCDNEVKLSHKQRRARRRVQNKRHKSADRKHGKRHGDKYLESLPRKKYLEADNYDHPTFRVEKGKLRPIHDVKRARETAKVRDALDVSPVERLTASILAHMSNHVFMWGEQLVYDLTEAICEEYKQPYPDDSYVTKDGVGIVHLTFQEERFEPGYGSYVEETDYRLN